jgi:hypothetical protein
MDIQARVGPEGFLQPLPGRVGYGEARTLWGLEIIAIITFSSAEVFSG